MANHNPDAEGGTVGLIRELREYFVDLARKSTPMKSLLLHRASNVEALGLTGLPFIDRYNLVHSTGAGNRDFFINLDANGRPKIRGTPVSDLDGNPITDGSGKPLDVRFPAHRQFMLFGEIDCARRLTALAERAGRLVSFFPDLPMISTLQHWRFSNGAGLWWSLLFETAWSQQNPLLSAKRWIWLPTKSDQQSSASLPYDIQEIRYLASKESGNGIAIQVPENWLTELPEGFVSEIDDTVSACKDAIDVILRAINAPPKLSGQLHNFTIFISYSHRDETFLEKLNKQLEMSGAEIWLDKKDLAAGPIEDQVSNAIETADVAIIVLSCNSIKSDWVEHEIELARSQEQLRGKRILCPIALDADWKSKPPNPTWRKLLKNFVIDFSGWEADCFDAVYSKLCIGLRKWYSNA